MVARRDLFKLLATVPMGLVSAAGRAEPAVEIVWRYRAKATVLMLSVPLFSRDNVGGGYLRLLEAERGGERHIEIEFAAGSLPERAAGLDRLGRFEESIVEAGGTLASASYSGFMTASNEKNLDQARAALHRGSAAAAAVTAIRGRISGARVWNRLVRLHDLPKLPWQQFRELSSMVQQKMDSAAGEEKELPASGPAQLPCPFLYSLRAAMRSREACTGHCFVHNGELLNLRATRQPGAKPRQASR